MASSALSARAYGSSVALLDLLRAGNVAEFNAKRPSRTTLDLFGADLAHLSLRGVDLSGANLEKADFSGCDLTGANLSGANLTGANLNRVNGLETANLSGVIGYSPKA